MIFNSVSFCIYLIVVVTAYWCLPWQRARMWLLFGGSLVFYGFWRAEFLILMLFSTLVDYVAASRIQASESGSARKSWLIGALTVNLSLLFLFKYLLFFTNSAITLARMLGVHADPVTWNIILPLGISFYTFHSMSYTIDVYRRFIKAERDYLRFGCYVVFFPQLVAGPILRAVEVIPQLCAKHTPQLENFVAGIQRIIFGLFLKVVLADNIAPLVDDGFALSVSNLSALDVWTLAFMFGFQIYFDFSAYSHIAIGCARLLGIHFPENFNFPFMAASPRDFWRRRHISLSSWIRDYLYLPLAGKAVQDRSTGGLGASVAQEGSRPTDARALFLTWAIMGLWHGANWTFVVWGLYHAACIYCYRLAAAHPLPIGEHARAFLGWSITLPLMMLGWVPFRASDIGTAISMWAKVFAPSQYLWLGLRENTYIIAFVLLLGFVGTYFIKTRVAAVLARLPALDVGAKTLVFAGGIALVFVFLRPIKQFIYFQF